ncbi:MAG: hypothetical protein HC828_12270 [Blastochloris sp.]|nr:hypothetical protein [Blastochloris sp.]
MADAGGRPGFHTVTPYLVHPDVSGLIAFIERAFGGVETFRSRGSAGGTHVELQVGDSMLMVGGQQDSTPFPAMLYLYVATWTNATGRRSTPAAPR